MINKYETMHKHDNAVMQLLDADPEVHLHDAMPTLRRLFEAELDDRDFLLDEKDVAAIATTVVARTRGAMRTVIGDRTPRQYDRADEMASAVSRAVWIALGEIGLYEPGEEHASA